MELFKNNGIMNNVLIAALEPVLFLLLFWHILIYQIYL